jgi:hypothetical protein
MKKRRTQRHEGIDATMATNADCCDLSNIDHMERNESICENEILSGNPATTEESCLFVILHYYVDSAPILEATDNIGCFIAFSVCTERTAVPQAEPQAKSSKGHSFKDISEICALTRKSESKLRQNVFVSHEPPVEPRLKYCMILMDSSGFYRTYCHFTRHRLTTAMWLTVLSFSMSISSSRSIMPLCVQSAPWPRGHLRQVSLASARPRLWT